jgi:hypothetical protein
MMEMDLIQRCGDVFPLKYAKKKKKHATHKTMQDEHGTGILK